jgi:hypothetical protein
MSVSITMLLNTTYWAQVLPTGAAGTNSVFFPITASISSILIQHTKTIKLTLVIFMNTKKNPSNQISFWEVNSCSDTQEFTHCLWNPNIITY